LSKLLIIIRNMDNLQLQTTHPVGESELGSSTAVVETCGGRLRVSWDDQAEVTAYGLLPFFSEFLRETKLFDRWVESSPLEYKSNNSHSVRDVLGTIMLSLLSGQKRYSHITSLRADTVAPSLFGMNRVVSEDSARRGLARIDEEAGSSWMQPSIREVSEELLSYAWILDVDTTIKPIYGHQEGAELGYNPQKPGRPSHAYHTYIMANTRLILDVEVTAGNEHTSLHAQPGLWKLIDSLPEGKKPSLLRGDCAFGNESFMSGAETRKIPYLFKLRKSKGVRSVISRAFSRANWENAGCGWEGRTDSLRLQGWSKERKVVVIRRKLKENLVLEQTASSKQMPLAFVSPEDPINAYEVAVLVTSLDEGVFALADLYRQRADAENVFDEIKNQWGWSGYTTHDIARCRLMARIGALVFNWWSVFVGLAFQDRHAEGITSRPLLLHAIGRKIRHSGQQSLSVTSSHGKRDKVQKRLNKGNRFLARLRGAAEQLSHKQKILLILSYAFARFLQNAVLVGPQLRHFLT
jgi:hypothetical protein